MRRPSVLRLDENMGSGRREKRTGMCMRSKFVIVKLSEKTFRFFFYMKERKSKVISVGTYITDSNQRIPVSSNLSLMFESFSPPPTLLTKVTLTTTHADHVTSFTLPRRLSVTFHFLFNLECVTSIITGTQ